MAEKTRTYTFIIEFSEADSERFEDFVRENGMKKRAVARKAILKYLEDAGN